MTPKKVKNYIRKTVHKVFRKELFKNTNDKSKIKYLTEGYIEDEKANYTNQHNRENTSIIFKARNRMLNITGNFKNKYQNLTCRLCNLQEETQEHILTQCQVTIENGLIIKKDLLFSRSSYILNNVVSKLKEIISKLENEENK